MAFESVTSTDSESFVTLWPHINQLESLLDVMNQDMCELQVADNESTKEALFNRAHNILGAATTIAGELAKAARVR